MRPLGQTVQGAPMAGPYQVYNPSQHSGQPVYAATNQFYPNSQQQIYVAAQGQPIQVKILLCVYSLLIFLLLFSKFEDCLFKFKNLLNYLKILCLNHILKIVF